MVQHLKALRESTSQEIEGEGKPEDIVQTETIRGRKGGTVTREIRRDGSVNVKRVEKTAK